MEIKLVLNFSFNKTTRSSAIFSAWAYLSLPLFAAMKINIDLQHIDNKLVGIGTRFSNCRFDDSEPKITGEVLCADITNKTLLLDCGKGVYLIHIEDVVCDKNNCPIKIRGFMDTMAANMPRDTLENLGAIADNLYVELCQKEIIEDNRKLRETT